MLYCGTYDSADAPLRIVIRSGVPTRQQQDAAEPWQQAEGAALQAQADTESRLAVDVKQLDDRSLQDAEGRAEKRLQEWRSIDRHAPQ